MLELTPVFGRSQIAGYDVRKKLPAVPSTLPVLILHGTADREFSCEHAQSCRRG